jgi:hypothetical protein
LSAPYFNPPTASPSITQASDSGANTVVSDNFVQEMHNAPTPNVGGTTDPRATVGRENSTGHFDWDQWDAVFGQHVAVDDPMTDLEWEEEQKATAERNDSMEGWGLG